MANLCYEDLVIGQDFEVPVIEGRNVKYVNLDNAASTPPLKKVMEKINQFAEVYSSVHRGNGFKSYISTEVYQQTREIVGNFVGADLNNHSIIFVKNSTEAINKLANTFFFNDGDMIIASLMEHHSNDLPWRKKVDIRYINVTDSGELDLDHLTYLTEKYKEKIKLVAVTGASNVTGYINPIHEISKITHSTGAKLLVDASQLAPHRQIDISKVSEQIDFIAFTAHKLYAPFGTGVLIGPKEFFNSVDPDHVGGGTVKVVTQNEVYWDETPERNEAGTPNVFGAVALASSINFIQNLGFDEIEKHENKLTQYLFDGLSDINDIKIYGHTEADVNKRLGVVSFNLKNMHHSIVAAILSYEYGIGVRNGCFCAHPYVLKLLNINSDEFENYKSKIINNDKSNVPGLVRISLGLYNTIQDIDRLVFALKNITQGKYHKDYVFDSKCGGYIPANWRDKHKYKFNLRS